MSGQVAYRDSAARAGATQAPWWYGGPCRCGREVFISANEGTCLLCGTGRAREVARANLRFRAQTLPRDLGPVLRDPCFPLRFDNVVLREHVDIMFGRAG